MRFDRSKLASVRRLQSLDPSACPNPQKIGFEAKSTAKKAAKRRGQTVYKCECGYFHLTSARKRRERERKRGND